MQKSLCEIVCLQKQQRQQKYFTCPRPWFSRREMVECHTKDRPSMMRCSSSSSSSHSVSVVTLPPSLPPYSSFFGILGILCLFRLLLSFPQRLFLTISQRRTKERGRVTWSTVLLFFLLPPSHTKYRRRNFCSSFSSFW